MEHLRFLVEENNDDDDDDDVYTKLMNPMTKEWNTLDNVYCRHNMNQRRGKLTVGYGFRSMKFGPELGFGWELSNTTESTILIIKATYGGATLAGDFRPPSSPLNGDEKFVLRNDNGDEDPSLVPGHRFYDMLGIISDTMSNLRETVGLYDATNGYVLKGFVWFQGFSDAISPKNAIHYEWHLRNFVKDVRSVLNIYETGDDDDNDDESSKPYPFLIGELGMQGKTPDPNHLFVRDIQQRVAVELQNDGYHTRFVPTSIYVPDDTTDYDVDGPGSYHYEGRADTYYNIGRAFANDIMRYYNDDDTDTDTDAPTTTFSSFPTQSPQPSPSPTTAPSQSPRPTPSPSKQPQIDPSETPSSPPTESPQPSPAPTGTPTQSPRPTPSPSAQPQTPLPSGSHHPTVFPSILPTESPQPSPSPTSSPTESHPPTPTPSQQPQTAPSDLPSISTRPTTFPSSPPTDSPQPSPSPTSSPTDSLRPTPTPSEQPQIPPSQTPSQLPSLSRMPTSSPTVSQIPSESTHPTESPEPSPSPSSFS